MNINKIELNDKWHIFLKLAAEAKMRNSGLNETYTQHNSSPVIERKSPPSDKKDALQSSLLNNKRYINIDNNKNNNKILGTLFDAYA